MCVYVAKPVAVELRCHATALIDQILYILAGEDDIHKSLHEIEIRPDPITDYRVSIRKKNPIDL